MKHEQKLILTAGRNASCSTITLGCSRVDVIFPDGHKGNMAYQEDDYVASSTLAIDKQIGRAASFFFVRIERFASQSVSWEIPCGAPNEGETALQTAQREFAEEGHLQARLWTPLQLQVENAGRGNSMTRTFMAAEISEAPPGSYTEDATEKILDRQWFTRPEIDELIAYGEIHTSHTLGSLQMAEVFFRRLPDDPISQLATR